MIRSCKKLIKFMILKIRLKGKVNFDFSSDISLDSAFEGMNKIHPHASFSGYLGFGSYIASYSHINGKIGKFSSIGPYVRCNSGRHPYTYPYVTTAPCFFSSKNYNGQNGGTFAREQCFEEFSYAVEDKKYVVIIGNDCWIGEGAFLVGGVNINDGAVVLAHAVVTKDVPPYAIVGGVPAKIIGYRYSEEDIKFLQRIQWWNNSKEWFVNNWKLLTDFSELKKYYNTSEGIINNM